MRRQIMDYDRKAILNARAKVLKAMAHPTRLFIIEELAKGERCVCELTELIGADISTVSKHLSVLKQAGVVLDDKRGNQVFYSLRVPCILNFFGCVESVLESNAREHAILLEAAAR
jgi:DNA-binding transcriptional ArsR family regulator